MMLKSGRLGLALVIIFIFATNVSSQGDFYYGGFHAQEVLDKCPDLRDSLRFNLVFLMNLDSIRVDSLAGLKVVAEQGHDDASPTYWSGGSYYTIWETHRLPGSKVGFNYKGGNSVYDPDAHGGLGDSVMLFSVPSNADTVQKGPHYVQYGLGSDDRYSVNFNLKFSGDRSDSSSEVCKIMVVIASNDSTVVESTLVVGDFPESGYDKFQLEYYYPTQKYKATDFRIYWYGVGSLYIDYVEVYNQRGYRLMSGFHDEDILSYVQQSWVDPSVIYRWYMKDEPHSVDCYMPYAHIDSLLQDSLPHIPGAQFTCLYGDTLWIHEYLTRSDPEEYMINAYPFGEEDTTESNTQQSLNWLTVNYTYNKTKAKSMNKDFWVAVQAHIAADKKGESPCGYGQGEIEHNGTIYCTGLKDPQPDEVRLITFLAMCYGVKAVMYYKIPFQDYDPFTPNHWETGLWDIDSNRATPKWEEIKNFTGPRVEKLGSIIADPDVEWLGAGLSDTVSSIEGSFIQSLTSTEYDTPYVQVGFFKDTVTSTDYFMLVNRKCTGNSTLNFAYQSQNVTCYIDKQDTLLIIDLYKNDTTVTGYLDIIDAVPFTTHLEPGEGKLFKLIPR